MAKEKPIVISGFIEEALPNTMFKVKSDKDHTVIAYVSGKILLKKYRILPGDRVDMEFSPYDLSKGRIVRTYKTK